MESFNEKHNNYFNSTCILCKKKSNLVSKTLGICLECIRKYPKKSRRIASVAHKKIREEFSLPQFPPKDKDGLYCGLCINNCKIGLNNKGYCGLRVNYDNKIISYRGIGKSKALVEWYYDFLPTNCVADWVCPGCSNSGFPQYSYSSTPEFGYKNLAVFFGACTLNCLFCQNWHFRDMTQKLAPIRNIDELVNAVDSRTSCICFFGGDPSTQMDFALNASQKAGRSKKGKHLRICWETNGTMSKKYLKKAVEISLKTGGCIKFDIKAFDSNLYFVLTGSSNKNTLKNFETASQFIYKRKNLPLVIASTLLVPGYIDEIEIKKISEFIYDCSPDIPYKLLGFHPQFYMSDLTPISKKLAYSCLETAKRCGLTNVDIGNRNLLL